MRIPALTTLLSVLCLSAGAQAVLENTPPSLHWYQVKTPHFRVIYGEGFDLQAERVANALEHIRVPEAKTIGSVPKKFPVVLQNHSTVSNGFVSILPRRSEFYAMPTQDYNFAGTRICSRALATRSPGPAGRSSGIGRLGITHPPGASCGRPWATGAWP